MNKEKEYDILDLLGWKDITTSKQYKNGTRIFQLPIKKYGQFIEVGSFKSGYVRRMNGGYTPYQLNKCEPSVEYYKDYKWCETRDEQYFTGKYNKFVGKRRILIDDEYDRINYLITFCLKNYYINQANMIENGKFIPKWKYEHELNRGGHYDKVRELQQEIDKLNNEIVDSRDRGMLDNLTVFVNNEKYKII